VGKIQSAGKKSCEELARSRRQISWTRSVPCFNDLAVLLREMNKLRRINRPEGIKSNPPGTSFSTATWTTSSGGNKERPLPLVDRSI
jgi:hypothetical protein